jgi:hypothetical protein
MALNGCTAEDSAAASLAPAPSAHDDAPARGGRAHQDAVEVAVLDERDLRDGPHRLLDRAHVRHRGPCGQDDRHVRPRAGARKRCAVSRSHMSKRVRRGVADGGPRVKPCVGCVQSVFSDCALFHSRLSRAARAPSVRSEMSRRGHTRCRERLRHARGFHCTRPSRPRLSGAHAGQPPRAAHATRARLGPCLSVRCLM